MLAASLLAALFAPSLVNAGLFPQDSLVKHITAKQFPKIMKENVTSVVAFVAPWCGHCKAMAPELSKAALGLYPVVPVYAVDCDDKQNQKLCSREGVTGFPTVKLFPRGKTAASQVFEGPRTASSFWYWATRRIPHKSKKLYRVEQIQPWVDENSDNDRVLLLTKDKTTPILWQALANKYRDQFAFANHRDRKGKSSEELGFEAGGKKDSKVLVYPKGSSKPVRFEGLLKLDSLSKFLESIIDGTADLSAANEEAAKEEYVVSPEEEEIQRQQEAQRIALAHGGFNDLIDFEEAIKKYGPDFHGSHGYAGVMGDMPLKKKVAKEGEEAAQEEAPKEKKEDPIHKILKAQKEREEKEAQKKNMPKTGDGAQVVFEAQTDAHTATATASSSTAATAAAAEEPITEETPVADEVPVAEANIEEADDAPEPIADAPESEATTEPVAVHEPAPETAEPETDPERKRDEL